MRIRLRRACHGGIPGQVLDVEDAEALRLIRHQFAIPEPVAEKPKRTPKKTGAE